MDNCLVQISSSPPYLQWKQPRKIFIDKTSKKASSHVFVWITSYYTFIVGYSYYKSHISSTCAFFFPFRQATSRMTFAPFSPNSSLRSHSIVQWISRIGIRHTIKIESDSFSPDVSSTVFFSFFAQTLPFSSYHRPSGHPFYALVDNRTLGRLESGSQFSVIRPAEKSWLLALLFDRKSCPLSFEDA